MRRFSICAVFLLLLHAPSLAQLPKVRFQNFDVTKGFPVNLCNNVLQDQQGFLWFYGDNGIYRYDGYSFKPYFHYSNDLTSISSNNIFAALPNKDGTLWVGTQHNGLNLLNPITGKAKLYVHNEHDPQSISSNSIVCIYRDKQNRLWIGTSNGVNLMNEDKGTFQHFIFEDGRRGDVLWKNNNVISDINEDKKGNLYFSTYDGLQLLTASRKNFTAYKWDTVINRASNNLLGKIYIDDPGMVWICSWGGGLKQFNPQTKATNSFTWTHLKPNGNHDILKAIVPRDDSTFWIASADAGFGIFNKRTGKFYFYQHEPSDAKSVASNSAWNLFADNSNGLWISLDNGMLSYINFKEPRFQFESIAFPIHSSLASHEVTTVLWDEKNSRWLTAGFYNDGVMAKELKHAKWAALKLPAEKGEEFLSVSDIAVDRQNTLWIAKNSEIYFQTRPAEPIKRLVSGNSRLRLPTYGQFFEDSKNHLWCYGRESIICIDPLTKRILPFDIQSLSSRSAAGFSSICEDNQHHILISEYDRSVFIVDIDSRKLIRHVTSPEEITLSSVYSLQKDMAGNIWMAGVGGISQCNTSDPQHIKTKTLGIENGLLNSSVEQIVCDDSGNAWALYQAGGVAKIDGKTLAIRNFDFASGWFSRDNTLVCLSYTNKNICIGTFQGFYYFNPDSFKTNISYAPLVLNSFKIFDKEYAFVESHSAGSIQLSYRQNFFSFDFAVLDYLHASQIQYAYRLRGFDKDWVYSGTRRYAAYTNMPGGNYVFEVKATNGDGMWSTPRLQIPIHITTAWWKQWWFYAIFSVITCVIVYTIYFYRLRQIRKIFAIRNRLASDLHDEVGSSLSSIRLLSDILETDLKKKDVKEQVLVQQIKNNATTSLEGMYDIIWELNPKNDHLEFLLSRLKEQTLLLTEQKNISLHWEVDNVHSSFKLQLEKRRDLYLVCKEAIQNALKYSQCDEILFNITYAAHQLNINIRDNGKGFSVHEKTEAGNGLRNMKQRMQRWKGSFELLSSTEGTTVKCTMPL